MGQLAAVAEEAGQLQDDLQHKASVIAAQVCSATFSGEMARRCLCISAFSLTSAIGVPATSKGQC